MQKNHHSSSALTNRRNWQKFYWHFLSKAYLCFGLTLIINGYFNLPVWSQTKNNQAKISINPQVIGDNVTLRVKVTRNNKLISNLEQQNFSIYVDCNQQQIQQCSPINVASWRNPKQSTPVASRIVILLDLSGSMKKPDKGGSGGAGNPKLQGAIDAIQEFTKVLNERGGDTQMVIVPFSDKAQYTKCNDYSVTESALNRFAPANSSQHQEDLQQLQNELDSVSAGKKNPNSRLCGETNLYQSLAKTVDFLNSLDSQSTQNQNPRSQPKLHIVLLSDGFNTVLFDESSSNICDDSHFNKLKQEYLQKSLGKIQIHTIGYGRTPSELGRDQQYSKVIRGQPAKCSDVEKFTDEKIREQFKSELVDQTHLQQIAQITGGIPEFSGNAKEIAQKFRDILDTILGEYEITYTQTGADTASEHNVRVVVQSIGEAQAQYSMPFVFQVPFNLRLWTILIFVLLPLSLGIMLLYLLAIDIKKQAQ